jgi:hypothetical protein
MVRVALILFLSLSSAVGPSLCCCLPGRLLGSGSLPGGGTSCGSHQCCGHSGPKQDQPQAPGGRGPHEPCPCQETQPVASAPQISKVSGDGAGTVPAFSFSFEPVASIILWSARLSRPGIDFAGGSAAFRGCDGRAILTSLHVLRC